MIIPKIGWVGAGNAKTGISAFLQHHLVGTGTHAFIIGCPIGSKQDIPIVFESDMRVSFDLWQNYLNDTNYDMWIYSIKGITQEEIAYSFDKCVRTFLGDAYGYAEWLWFPYRMVCEKILHLDVRKQNNWFKRWAMKSSICTELGWWFLWFVTELNPEKWTALREILCRWNPDALTANDWLHILEDNKDIFQLELQRINRI
jgi:hypothetical protein